MGTDSFLQWNKKFENSTVVYMEDLQEFQDFLNENIERLKEKL